MELAALYDLRLGHHALLSLYAAPIGDPALGPTAYPHRLSASEDPIAALGHHQEDSTHIAFSVLTAGLTWRSLRFEQSSFHGAEPNEGHWRFQPSPNGLALDSYASRLTWSPTRNLAAQYSRAHLAAPESLYPHENQACQTASLMLNLPFRQDLSRRQGTGVHSGNLSATALWGRTNTTSPTHTSPENSYLLEALLRVHADNYLWTRLENAGRSNELLLSPGTPLPLGFEESPIGHVAAYTAGYDHDLHLLPHLLIAPEPSSPPTPPPAPSSPLTAPTPMALSPSSACASSDNLNQSVHPEHPHMTMTLYIATTNPGKLRDFAHAADQTPDQAGITLLPLPNLKDLPTPEETEPTFEGNATLKAVFYSRHSPGLLALADDSGLEVDALHGAPGVRSARYAEDHAIHQPGPRNPDPALDPDTRNNQLLLLKLGPFAPEQRRARYRCALVAALDGIVLVTTGGTLEGTILSQPRGTGGFGYDPLFLIPDLDRTMAEIDPTTRLSLSHRGRALRALLPQLVLLDGPPARRPTTS